MFDLSWDLMNVSHCSSNNIGPMYVEVSGRSAQNVPGGLDFLWFRPPLGSGFLQAQLIQNLWNLLELNKIYMEHGAKTQFISEKLTVKMWNNGRQHPPKLKLLLVLEQNLILRLCKYPAHSILLYPYVRRVSWLIPICSDWWGWFHISSLVLSGWRTEQPSPEYFPAFPVQVHSRNIFQVCI